MTFKIDIKGIRTTQSNLANELTKRFEKAADVTLAEVQKEAHIITGKLKRGYRITRSNSNGFTITNTVPYANTETEFHPEQIKDALSAAEPKVRKIFNTRKNI